MESSEAFSAIARIMWSVMPESAVEFRLLGKIYEDFWDEKAILTDESGGTFQFGFDDYPSERIMEIMRRMSSLREMAPFKMEPWTHFQLTLKENGKFKAEFAYVPREKDVIGIYMREGAPEELAAQSD